MKKILSLITILACAVAWALPQVVTVTVTNDFALTADGVGYVSFVAQGASYKVITEKGNVFYTWHSSVTNSTFLAATNVAYGAYASYPKFATTTEKTVTDGLVKGGRNVFWLYADAWADATETNATQDVYFQIYD